ncbi:PRD domain-containing protein [Paenibacillus sp. NPDC056579]|uniref:PRD domain-containing protein n=1 Tax=unclassified Paenibacillus TaxID=185978 RepID=UPI001EF7AF2D|nr:PRD domain-containing protein [Paenibacillus sp. H1-7]ULL18267.1 PRD domain-containing protein [Paenibacillus sp. H1-7]
MQIIETILNEIPDKTTVTTAELEQLRPLLTFTKASAEEAGLTLTHDKLLIIGIHLLAYMRRVRNNEYLPELEESMFEEVTPELVELSKRVLSSYEAGAERKLDAAEIFYLTVHFEAAKFNEEE